MSDFISFFGKFTYVMLIVGSVFLGVSLAVNSLISTTLKRVNNASKNNAASILNKKQLEGLNAVSENAKKKYLVYLDEAKKIKKIKTRNKVFGFLGVKKKQLPTHSVTLKEIIVDLAKDVYAKTYSENNTSVGFLSFTEREIFNILDKLTIRIEKILQSSGIVLLKNVKLSFVIQIISYYSLALKFKNKLIVSTVLYFVNFFMWFGKFLSPVGMGKYLIKSGAKNGLSYVVATTFIDVVAGELAVLYQTKGD